MTKRLHVGVLLCRKKKQKNSKQPRGAAFVIVASSAAHACYTHKCRAHLHAGRSRKNSENLRGCCLHTYSHARMYMYLTSPESELPPHGRLLWQFSAFKIHEVLDNVPQNTNTHLLVGRMVLHAQRSAVSQHTYVKFFVRVRRWFPHEDMHYVIHENNLNAHIYTSRDHSRRLAGGDFQPRHRTNNARQPGYAPKTEERLNVFFGVLLFR